MLAFDILVTLLMLAIGAFFIAGHLLLNSVYQRDQWVTNAFSVDSHIVIAPWELWRGLIEHPDLELLVHSRLSFSQVNVNWGVWIRSMGLCLRIPGEPPRVHLPNLPPQPPSEIVSASLGRSQKLFEKQLWCVLLQIYPIVTSHLYFSTGSSILKAALTVNIQTRTSSENWIKSVSLCLSSACKRTVSILTANLVPHKPKGASWQSPVRYSRKFKIFM